MRRMSGVVALLVVVALAGCAKPMAVAYEGALSREPTSAAGAVQATATPLAVKSSAKGETVIEVSTGRSSGSGGTATSSGISGGLRATGSVSPSRPSSGGSVTITVKVVTNDGKPVSGAKVTVTCHYQSLLPGLATESSTFSMTTNSSGTCSKTRDATPFNGPTFVGVSGTVSANGSTQSIRCQNYSIN